MNKVDLDALEALEAKATPGPWRDEIGCYEDSQGAHAIGPYCDAEKYEDEIDESGEWLWEIDAYKDAALIKFMRNNIKPMIAELRAAREVISVIKGSKHMSTWSRPALIQTAVEMYDEVTCGGEK